MTWQKITIRVEALARPYVPGEVLQGRTCPGAKLGDWVIQNLSDGKYSIVTKAGFERYCEVMS